MVKTYNNALITVSEKYWHAICRCKFTKLYVHLQSLNPDTIASFILYSYIHGGSKRRPFCFTPCNFGNVDQISTKFGTNQRFIYLFYLKLGNQVQCQGHEHL